MALTFLSDLLPYDQYLRTGYIEQLTYAVNILNAASGGTIRLESENTTGTKKHEAFFRDFGTMERRDITTDSAQVAEKIERAEHTAFKTFWKFKPVAWQWTAFKTSDNMTNDEVMFMVGRKLAERKWNSPSNRQSQFALPPSGAAQTVSLMLVRRISAWPPKLTRWRGSVTLPAVSGL